MPDQRNNIAGVRFGKAGKIEYYHASGMRLEAGESVVVETSRGPIVGRIVIAPDQVVVNELGKDSLPPILRLATDEDLLQADELTTRASNLIQRARQLAKETGFEGHLDAASFPLDGKRITFSFTSEDRQEYRDFVRAASKEFDVRVDMRHLGARDRAKMLGGYGICGRELCCSSWLTTFPSISIRMAKEQELPLNPDKISGLCGRLLCCLSYEHEGYKEMRRTLPKIGQLCSTPTGEGKVVAVNVLRRQVTLRVGNERIEVGPADLGLVVRWDPSRRDAEPPASLTRDEAIAQGFDVPELEEEVVVPEEEVDASWFVSTESVAASASAPPKRGRGRRQSSRRDEERGRGPEAPRQGEGRAKRKRGGNGSPSAGDPPRGQARRPENLPEGRVFKRSTGEAGPAAERPSPQPPKPAGESSPSDAPKPRRRRRGRQRGGSRGSSGD